MGAVQAKIKSKALLKLCTVSITCILVIVYITFQIQKWNKAKDWLFGSPIFIKRRLVGHGQVNVVAEA